MLILSVGGCVLPGIGGGEGCPTPEGWIVSGPLNAEGRTGTFADGKYDRILFFGKNTLGEEATMGFVVGTDVDLPAPRVRYISGFDGEPVPTNGSIMGSATQDRKSVV